MAILEPPTAIQQQLQAKFDNSAPKKIPWQQTFNTLIPLLQYKIGNVHEDLPKLPKKRSTKFMILLKTEHNHVVIFFQRAALFHERQHMEL